MKKNENVFIKIIIYFLVIIILFVVIILTNKPREDTVVETVFSYTVIPIQKGYKYFTNWVMGYKDIFPQIDELTQKNTLLEQENKELKEKLSNYEILISENRMLKQQMNLIEKYPEYTTLAAQVVAQDTNSWYEILVINQGSDNGVEQGMTVISDKGLVGYVKEVSNDTSKVLCIIDAGNSVSSKISKTSQTVICRGELDLKENSQMKLVYIPTDAEISKGDIVETSGLGGIYKKGIKIGEIEEVVSAQNSFERYARVKTSVDFSRLEYVTVIMD